MPGFGETDAAAISVKIYQRSAHLHFMRELLTQAANDQAVLLNRHDWGGGINCWPIT